MRWPLGIRDATPVLENGRLRLRAPKRRDYPAWLQLRRESRDHLKPYEPRWTESDMQRSAFEQRVRRGAEEAAAGTDFMFFAFLVEEGRERLVGGLTLSNIRRRAAQHATLGYWMGQRYSGQGLMTAAVALTLPFAFETLGLHRIHAAFLPENAASRRVLAKNGFVEEGFAERYLQIDGAWADHVLCGLTRESYDLRRFAPRR